MVIENVKDKVRNNNNCNMAGGVVSGLTGQTLSPLSCAGLTRFLLTPIAVGTAMGNAEDTAIIQY